MKVMTIVPLVAEYGQVVLYTVIQLDTNKLHSLPCIVYTVLVSCTVQASHTASSCTMYIVPMYNVQYMPHKRLETNNFS